MCGIAGILRTWAVGEAPPPVLEAIPEAWLDVLDESIKHRGPDGQGRFRQRVTQVDGTVVDVALVHRRLSIIDHACGAQPMVLGSPPLRGGSSGPGPRERQNEGPLISREGLPYGPVRAHVCPKCGPGVAAVVFNGCIYNHRELRRELEAAGHEFFTDHSDTEVLLHGWHAWGSQIIDRIEGMYAAVIWDSRTPRLVALRDDWGEKPLYWGLAEREPAARLGAFGSCIGGIVRLNRTFGGSGGSSTKLFAHGLRQWIGSGWAASHTPFDGIDHVTPNTCVDLLPLDPDEFEWSWGGKHHGRLLHQAKEPRGRELSVDEVDEQLRIAVHTRLEADVAVGCFLSGGIDSALITRYASETVRDLTAFTVRMPSPEFDEAPAAAVTAKHLGVRHEVLDCQGAPASDLIASIEQLGLPFGDSSLLPTTWVSRAARQRVAVALAGDGGDEFFLGYDRHRAIKPLYFLQLLPQYIRREAAELAEYGGGPRSLRSRFARLVSASAGSGYMDLLAMFPHPLDELLGLRPVCREMAERAEALRWTMPWRLRMPMKLRDMTSFALWYDQVYYLPDDILRKSDTASMSVALELRAPFLARGVVGPALAATLGSLMPRGQRKGLLRAVARKYLPAEIVDRPKMGFAIPIGEWFRSDYGGMRQLLYDHLRSADPFPGLADAGIELNMDFVRRMLREHDAAGEKSLNPWHGRDHSQRLYMLLVLSIWCRWLRAL
jgi:asparagine synthase (glutamine-hydrolysing)